MHFQKKSTLTSNHYHNVKHYISNRALNFVILSGFFFYEVTVILYFEFYISQVNSE
jgi:hypothetical protein